MTGLVVGLAGMTHLGVNMAAAFTERGFNVICHDRSRDLIERLGRLDPPFMEPGLAELLRRNRQRMSFTTATDPLAVCDVVYVCPDVPTDADGRSDLEPVAALIRSVDGIVRSDACLVILSQVPPGFTRAVAWESCPLYCQVETLIFGSAVQRALEPERLIVGCADPSVPLPENYQAVLSAFGCPILPMRYESAELTKIAINCFLAASVTTTNTLAEICERIGADWSDIAPALRLDERIGPHAYLAPGLGIAGGNLERDLNTLQRYAEANGTDAGVIRAVLDNSSHRRNWALDRLHRTTLCKLASPTIGVLGLAYKADTDSVKNSAAVELLNRLSRWPVQVHDPAVDASIVSHPDLTAFSDPLQACDAVDALVIMTPWSPYRSLDPYEIARRMRGNVVIDPHGVLDETRGRGAGLVTERLGRGEALPIP